MRREERRNNVLKYRSIVFAKIMFRAVVRIRRLIRGEYNISSRALSSNARYIFRSDCGMSNENTQTNFVFLPGDVTFSRRERHQTPSQHTVTALTRHDPTPPQIVAHVYRQLTARWPSRQYRKARMLKYYSVGSPPSLVMCCHW